jgi:sporulation protein YlmC with PRC-barrel domain
MDREISFTLDTGEWVLMECNGQKLRISDLLNCRIVTAEGKVIGHVADVQLTSGPEYRVTGLLFGRQAWLHRLHMLNPFEHYTPREPDRVPWEAVASIKHPIITLKPEYDPEKHEMEHLL